jgi:hypothetical protein
MPGTSRSYNSLEPSLSQSLGLDAFSFSTANPVSFLATTNFLYSLAIMLSVLAAGFIYARAGLWRMQASEAGVRKSNEEIKRATLGLLGVLSLFVILYTFNKGLLSGEVGLKDLRTGGYTSGGGGLMTGVVPSTGPSAPSASCQDTKAVISQLTAPGGICGNTRCSALSGCTYQQYLPLIRQEAAKAGIDYKIVVALMCRESRGKADAKSTLPENNTYDCGLMQINQTTPCTAAIMDPSVNIAQGVATIKSKLSQANQIYQNIPQQLGAYASYNCCGNKTIPNAPSVDCTQASGFPFSIPKWACPINPGEGKFNMCFVKGYACEVNACVEQLKAAEDL